MPWYLGNSLMGGSFHWGWILPLAVWSGLWTGIALWHAARRDEKGWFVLFMIVHTAGILEILYLIFVAKAFSKSDKKKTKNR